MIVSDQSLTATGISSRGRFGFPGRALGLYHTAARRAGATQSSIYNRGCTSHADVYLQGFCRTILGTGSAFHAGIPVFNAYLAIILCQDPVRTYFQAHPATETLFRVKAQGYYILQIDESFHDSIPLSNEERPGPEKQPTGRSRYLDRNRPPHFPLDPGKRRISRGPGEIHGKITDYSGNNEKPGQILG
jgi:hypothetical protein